MSPLPVIIVPGIMGTRLVDASGRSVWDPDPGAGAGAAARTVWRADIGALGDVGRPLGPNPRTDRVPSSAPARVRAVPGVGGLVWGAYDRLVVGLTDPSFTSQCGGGIRVYVAGYDWRQSNLTSAGTLVTTVRQALVDTGERRVAIVAHSMGGLVARAFARLGRIGAGRGEDVLAGLILLGSPTHGASKAYRALRQSFLAADDIADIDLGTDVAGEETPEGIVLGGLLARYARRFPAIYELLPTAAFCRAHPRWVQFDPRRTALPDASDPDRLYADAHTGVGSPGLRRARMLAQRSLADRAIGSYLPPRTMMLYSSQLDTETLVRIARLGRLERQGGASDNLGDGTVPTYSGAARGISTRAYRRDLGNIGHGGLANDPRAVAEVQRLLLAVCRHATAAPPARTWQASADVGARARVPVG